MDDTEKKRNTAEAHRKSMEQFDCQPGAVDNQPRATKMVVCYSFEVDCPYCDALLDLVDQDEDACFSKHIFNNDWYAINGMEAVCPDCGKKFSISEVEC